jgi:cytochrome c-type biogenesis protein CcmH
VIRALLLLVVLAQGMNDSTLDARTREVASTLRCPACEDVSIEDSPADLARDMRKVVRQQLAEGRTPAQVKQYFVDRYGAWVLLDPAVTRRTAPLWFLPVFAVLMAGAALVIALRRWNRASHDVRDGESRGDANIVRARAPPGDANDFDELEADRLEGKISDGNYERLRRADDALAPVRTADQPPRRPGAPKAPHRRKGES